MRWLLKLTAIELALLPPGLAGRVLRDTKLAVVENVPQDLVVLSARGRETLALVGRRIGLLPTWERVDGAGH